MRRIISIVTVVAIMVAILGLTAPQAFAEGNANQKACKQLIGNTPPHGPRSFFPFNPGFFPAGCPEEGEPF